MYTISILPAESTYPLRSSVLRNGKPFSQCVFEGDTDATTYHFGCLLDHQVVAIVSCYAKSHDLFNEKKAFQVRGMAVAAENRGKKMGEQLLLHVEKHLQDTCCEPFLIWLNARENALGFYQKMGYQVKGTAFEVVGIGIHYLMYKHV